MDSHLQLAIAEGFGESPIGALLGPDVEPSVWLGGRGDSEGVPPRVRRRLADPGLAAEAWRVRERAADLGFELLTPADPRFPSRLRSAPLRPLVLFARGDAAVLELAPAVAVVGSRTPTPYGQQVAEQLARALARAGIALWSGLARGIDGIAHRAALAMATPTVAVLAGGLDRIYPPEHAALADEIVARAGCLVAELPPGRRARRGHFVRRNRILAGATAATLVVEGSLTSGALHTARFAAEAGADVFAVPGPIHSELSQGCHRLVVEGAQLVEGPEALLRDLGVAGQGRALELTGSADEQAVLAALAHGGRPSDLLERESGLERATFVRALLRLEERGGIRRLPGDLWIAVC